MIGFSRRRFIGTAAFTAACATLPARAGLHDRLYLNAYGSAEGFGVAGFDADGAIRYSFALPQRGHSFARHPHGSAVIAFARRPGSYALVFDPRDGRLLERIAAADDRNFCGHGAFSADGRLLFATEVIASEGEGVLGIYDTADGWRRVGEWKTHGLDPHEIRLMPGGDMLVVANGGILMRSDMPRLKLNIPDMAPSLVYLDARDGRLVARIAPPQDLRQLSIRHIAIDRRGRVAIAMQYEGPVEDAVPLVALHDGPGGVRELRFLPLAETERQALRQYCGSAAMDAGGRYLAVSSPRGNRVLVWDLDDDRLPQVARLDLPDVCGIAATAAADGFVLSSGISRRVQWQDGQTKELPAADRRLQWDNHMLALPA